MRRYLLTLGLAACNPVGDVVDYEHVRQLGPPTAAAPQEPPAAQAASSLRVAPEPELVGEIEAAAADYWETFGLRIEIAEDGIPITVVPEIVWGSGYADGWAHYDRYCEGYECSPAHGVWITVSEELVTTKVWALQQTLLHELGHVLSGWGRAADSPSHLGAGEGVMAPGCRNHVCAPWSALDAELICAGAPCQWIRL